MKIQDKKKCKKNKKTSLTVKKAFQQIEVDNKVQRQNARTFKGNRKDTNLLNINFKTRVCRVLQQMRLTKQMTGEEVKIANDFKDSSPSFQNLVSLIYQSQKLNQKSKPIANSTFHNINCKCSKENDHQLLVKSPNIFLRLKRLFQSSQIVKSIYENEGTLKNKLLMLKYIEAIRYTVIGSGKITKWKNLRQVSERE